MKCILCKYEIEVEISGWSEGHNAQPLAEGRCCSDCNEFDVLPARIQQVKYSSLYRPLRRGKREGRPKKTN